MKSRSAVPHIAFEPNRGPQEVQDGPYLRRWRAARAAGCPIFLRWASEMNGHWTAYHAPASLYIEKFRLIHRVMTRKPQRRDGVDFLLPSSGGPMRFRAWYPGDAYVDWVGVNIYSVCHYSGSLRLKAVRRIAFARFQISTGNMPRASRFRFRSLVPRTSARSREAARSSPSRR